jgi:hypothetical protein
LEELVDYYPLGRLNFSDTGEVIKDFSITGKDKKILRELAKKKAYIAEDPAHQNKASLWKDLNDLKETRPLVWINEIPWHEMNSGEELTLVTGTKFGKYLETRLRRTIYLWEHLPVDSIVEPVIPCYLMVNNTGFGISEETDIATTDENSDIISREFIQQIKSGDDIEKIKTPVISFNRSSTEEKFHVMQEVFDGILEVRKKGIPGFWFAPWDELIRWWGVQEALTDMVLRPDFVHMVMRRLTDAYLNMLDQFEEKNLLELNNCNYRIGSGGLGFTDQLPQPDLDPSHIRAFDLWGCGAAQIFSGVSPGMHFEFSLQYEIEWMKRFGLNYYGCCEPLHKKTDILKKIPNLRKISMSPWIDLDHAAEAVGPGYVFSFKPNPAIFSEEKWDLGANMGMLRKDIKKLKGCRIEIIMKDISTVKYEPQRLWQWAGAVMKLVEEIN